jgi:tripartite-type tricarboxylate transporter receptor subunit TctC
MNFFQSMRPSKTVSQYFLGTASVLTSSLLLNMAAQISAMAQAAPYPTKSITMIVPFPPGGLADIVARPVAEAMSRELGQPVIIENKGGAGGGIGMGVAARSKPDGYTVLLALSSLTVIPEADALLGRNPMFLLNELRPIARYTADPTVLAVRADAPWKTVKEFVEDARKRPGAINYGSSGNYGTKLTHIPFTGAGPAVVAMLGGQIDALSTGPATVLQHVKAGKIRVLGHWGNGALASMPEVSSLKDLGFNAEYAQWSGLFIPSGIPEPIAQRLRAAAKMAAQDAKAREVIQNTGSPVQYLDSPDFEKYVQADAKRMTDVVKKIGKVE